MNTGLIEFFAYVNLFRIYYFESLSKVLKHLPNNNV